VGVRREARTHDALWGEAPGVQLCGAGRGPDAAAEIRVVLEALDVAVPDYAFEMPGLIHARSLATRTPNVVVGRHEKRSCISRGAGRVPETPVGRKTLLS
jgi:hypothetical protein